MAIKRMCDTCGKECGNVTLSLKQEFNGYVDIKQDDFCSAECLLKFLLDRGYVRAVRESDNAPWRYEACEESRG